jgi:secreted Zn-dependent insulinase-like peptidase
VTVFPPARDYADRAHSVLRFALLALLLLPLAAKAVVVKSENDDRDYRYLQLDNDLPVLLISDPNTDTAAASMDVRVGSGSDPADRQGLAHFLEHMLFLGTEKFPRPGEYQAFIASHGGSHNAYTDFDDTNYFFSVDAEHLEPALDRFAQFFISPLFTPAYVEREMNAVHSEYQIKLSSEYWRAAAARKQILNPAHPDSRFSIGALDTLADRPGDPVRDDLLAFYAEHYSADRMGLVVLGREPLDQLQSWARERFSAVPKRDIKREQVLAPLFQPGTLPARLEVVPVKEQRRLQLSFPVPNDDDYYRSKPLLYLADLLGHEGEGSLLSLLKARGWANDLSASSGRSLGAETTFELSMNLTESGLAAVDEIVARTFAYLRLVANEGINEWRFKEHQQLAEIDFRFAEKGNPMHYASSLARMVPRYPPEDLLRLGYLWDDYDPALIRDYLQRLNPDNVLITVIAPALETDRTEPWFGTSYALREVPADTLVAWRTAEPGPMLATPAPNPFIPQDLALTPGGHEGGVPKRLESAPGFAIWWLQDSQFDVPRADFRVSVDSPAAREGARAQALLQLYTRVVEESLNEFSYPARIAGLGFSLTPTLSGFNFELNGYNDRQILLLDPLLQALRSPHISPERFDDVKAALTRELENSNRDDPSDQAFAELSNLLISPYWSEAELLKALAPLALDDLHRFVPHLLARLDSVALAHGNLLAEDARAMGERVRRELVEPAEIHEVADPQVVQLPVGPRLPLREISVSQSDSALTLYVQGHDTTLASRARMGLLAQVVSTPFYEELRTERQLGYLVFASAMPLLEVPGMVFAVQSPVAGPEQILAAVDEFLDQYGKVDGQLSKADVERHKGALISKLLERPQSLSEQTDRLWSDLRNRRYSFDTRERIAEEVKHLTREDLDEDYLELLGDQTRLAIAVAARGAGREPDPAAAAADRLITDVRAFKAGQPVVPKPMPDAAATVPALLQSRAFAAGL